MRVAFVAGSGFSFTAQLLASQTRHANEFSSVGSTCSIKEFVDKGNSGLVSKRGRSGCRLKENYDLGRKVTTQFRDMTHLDAGRSP